MDVNVKLEREKRKNRRRRKRIRTTAAAITLLLILTTIGAVHAQSQGYEVLYNGESLGYVRTTEVFNSAVEHIEDNLGESYNNENIVLGSGFELVPARVENPMDFETWIQVLNKKGIELYANGAMIIIGNQEMGAVASTQEALRLVETYENLYPNGNPIRYVETRLPLSETKDFGTILTSIKGTKK